MAKRDTPVWTLAGIFIGMVTAAVVNQEYVLPGALFGAVIGYILGRKVQ